MTTAWTGGCQCGAVRFRASALGRASICHCRMCQKAFAGIGGLLVTAGEVDWTRGAPRHFASSDRVKRGFCGDCGTPLTFEYPGGIDLAIPTFDRAAEIAPVVQLAHEAKLPWADDLSALPTRPASERLQADAWYASVTSRQHPDHDTDTWRSKP